MALRVSRKPSAVSWARIFSGITAVFCRLFFTVVSHCRLDAQKAFTLRHRDCVAFRLVSDSGDFKNKKKNKKERSATTVRGDAPLMLRGNGGKERKKERKEGRKKERKCLMWSPLPDVSVLPC